MGEDYFIPTKTLGVPGVEAIRSNPDGTVLVRVGDQIYTIKLPQEFIDQVNQMSAEECEQMLEEMGARDKEDNNG